MNRIKDLRAARGWNQDALGKKIGVTRTALGNYEREDRQLDPETIGKLCDLFGVTADYLLGRSEIPAPDQISADEWSLIRSYRELDADGRAFVRHSLALAALGHSGKNPAVSELEEGSE